LSSGIKKIPRLRNGLPSISSDMLKSKFLELIAGKGMGLFSSGDTLETIENLDKTCIKFNNIFHSWQFTYDKKIRENSVYIPPHR